MENNKIIADFMDMKYAEERTFTEGKWIHSIRSLSKFQTDWNWLMEVVEKIYSLELECEEVLIIRDALAEANRVNVYQAVVAFIEWYNEQNK